MQSSDEAAGRDATAAVSARLHDLTHGALHRALRADGDADGELREMLREACDAARERGLPVERLLVLFKQAWRELPEARTLPPHDAGSVLAGVITRCIEEYYRPPGGPASA